MKPFVIIDGRRFLSTESVNKLRGQTGNDLHQWVERCARLFRVRVIIAFPPEYPRIRFYEESSIQRAVAAEKASPPKPPVPRRTYGPMVVGLSRICQATGLATEHCRVLVKRPDLCPPVERLERAKRGFACSHGFSEPSVEVFRQEYRQWTERAPRKYAKMLKAVGVSTGRKRPRRATRSAS